MANIKVQVDYPIKDGVGFTFHAPCDCSAVEGITVVHPGGTQNFAFKDSHGNYIAGINNLFAAGSLIKAVLDVTNSAVFIQNADTNGYLEQRLSEIGVVSARMDELVAMRSPNVAEVYEIDSYYTRNGTIKSNGVAAEINIELVGISNMSGDGNDFDSDYCIPPALLPMSTVNLIDLNDEGLLVAFINPEDVNASGYGRIRLSMIKEGVNIPYQAYFGGRYDLASLSIAELSDIRIGTNDRNYDSAGAAVRATQETVDNCVDTLNGLDGDMSELHRRVLVLEKNGTGGGGASLNDSTISASSTWSSQKISEELAKLSYEPISIESFRATPSSAEIGAKVDVTLSWELNKAPQSVKISGDAVSATESGSKNIVNVEAPANYPSITSKTFRLQATDSEGTSVSDTVYVYFHNAVYYGASAKPNSYNSDFITALSGKALRGSKLTSLSVDAGGNYVYYCLPTRYGTCSFTVNGFTGGFVLDGTVSFTNQFGYTENYYVYRSSNTLNGTIAITVS